MHSFPIVDSAASHGACVMLDQFVYGKCATRVPDLIAGPHKQAGNHLPALPSAGDLSCLSLLCYRLLLLIWL